MTETVTAVYENGAYRPVQPQASPPAEGATVRLTVGPADELIPAEQTAALMRRIAARHIDTGPVEHTSEQVDVVLYGKADPV